MLEKFREQITQLIHWEIKDKWNAKRVVHRVNGEVETLRYYRHKQIGDAPSLAGNLIPQYDWVEVPKEEYEEKLKWSCPVCETNHIPVKS